MFPYFPSATDDTRKRRDEDRPARAPAPKRTAAVKARANREDAKREEEEEDNEETEDPEKGAKDEQGEDAAEAEEDAEEEGIEKILSFRLVRVGEAPPQREYRTVESGMPNECLILNADIKWKSKSYHKCTWLTEEKLNAVAPHRLRHFKRLIDTDEPEPDLDDYKDGIKSDWLDVERIIAKRESRAGEKDFLVKWKEQQYNQCTWETEAELATLGAKAEIELFEKFSQMAASPKHYPSKPVCVTLIIIIIIIFFLTIFFPDETNDSRTYRSFKSTKRSPPSCREANYIRTNLRESIGCVTRGRAKPM